ncbi:MAG: hypothetical protein OWR52_09660 [Acidibacillus sp.]|nr:hypothetical protein [Acidibacillus sp.]
MYKKVTEEQWIKIDNQHVANGQSVTFYCPKHGQSKENVYNQLIALCMESLHRQLPSS